MIQPEDPLITNQLIQSCISVLAESHCRTWDDIPSLIDMVRKKPAPAPIAFISLAEAADRIGVSTRTLRRYVAAGTIKAHRVGPRLLKIDPDDLNALYAPVGAGH